MNDMIIKQLSTKDQEIIKYFSMYLADEPESFNHFMNSEYYEKLDELMGGDIWSVWLLDLIQSVDLEEYKFLKEITKDQQEIIHYTSGGKNSFAYRWLIKFLREIKLEELGI